MVKRSVLYRYLGVLAASALWPAVSQTILPRAAIVRPVADLDALRWIPPGNPSPRTLTALEQRFAAGFPGRIDRYVDTGSEWIVRGVDRPTRMLHPAADCFRGLGYTLTPPRVHLDLEGERWNCFSASRRGDRRRVCERIFDAGGGRWTDVSSWYWAASLEATGPWWAITRVSRE